MTIRYYSQIVPWDLIVGFLHIPKIDSNTELQILLKTSASRGSYLIMILGPKMRSSIVKVLNWSNVILTILVQNGKENVVVCKSFNMDSPNDSRKVWSQFQKWFIFYCIIYFKLKQLFQEIFAF